MSNVHELKVYKRYFIPLALGDKTFEVRRDDRCFGLGDVLVLNEIDDESGRYTGRFALRVVTYVLADSEYCVEGYVILGLQRLSIT